MKKTNFLSARTMIPAAMIMAGIAGAATTACTEETVYPVVYNAQMPVITEQPKSGDYGVKTGDTKELVIKVDVPKDGGTLAFKWQKGRVQNVGDNPQDLGDGSAALDETGTVWVSKQKVSLSIADTGTFYYRVVITNTNSGVSGAKVAVQYSAIAKIVVGRVLTAPKPEIKTQPTAVDVRTDKSPQLLKVVVEDPERDDLTKMTYSWWKSDYASGKDSSMITDTELTADTNSVLNYTYNVPLTMVGTYYVFARIVAQIAEGDGVKKAMDTTLSSVVKVNVYSARAGIKDLKDLTAVYGETGKQFKLTEDRKGISGGTQTYQWQYWAGNDGWKAYTPDSTAKTLTVSAVSVGEQRYRVKVMDAVTSPQDNDTAYQEVKLTVGKKEAAVTIDSIKNVTESGADSVQVWLNSNTAKTSGTITYEWHKISGGADSKITGAATHKTAASTGDCYYVIVAAKYGEDTATEKKSDKTATSNIVCP